MATPSNLVLRSDLDFDAGKREAILETWDRQIADGAINVMLNADVAAITGEKGDFAIELKGRELVDGVREQLHRQPIGDVDTAHEQRAITELGGQ